MRKVPPAEINGSGKPLTGIRPTVMAEFTKTCAKSIELNPIKIRLENLSFERKELRMIILIKYPKVNRMTIIDIKPNSSPITDNIKSDS